MFNSASRTIRDKYKNNLSPVVFFLDQTCTIQPQLCRFLRNTHSKQTPFMLKVSWKMLLYNFMVLWSCLFSFNQQAVRDCRQLFETNCVAFSPQQVHCGAFEFKGTSLRLNKTAPHRPNIHSTQAIDPNFLFYCCFSSLARGLKNNNHPLKDCRSR